MDELPVRRAVASSSAFPILLSPVTYKTYPASKGFDLNRDIKNGLKDQYNGPDPRRYMWAYNQSIYHTNKAKHLYVHPNVAKVEDAADLRRQGCSRSHLLQALDNAKDAVSSAFPKGKQHGVFWISLDSTAGDIQD